ncbi:Extracellular serine protease precursor [Pannonibacter phragmitetus]|uniref:Extracellular serine protease n=1 Tax=Pannonibacter phragmitetus TaxID=121719 RepID=A0A379A0Q2_9HYPH|nr:S8 family serine peptidase [Pannonibacter phragmitetus]SUB02783.1 Extracellular serine protease precursor [Pannonibacter phragmitetus]
MRTHLHFLRAALLGATAASTLFFGAAALQAAPLVPVNEYDAQWGLLMTGAPIAHSRGYTGAGVTVGVLDTGILASHPDLIANLSGLNFNGFEEMATFTDADGHGTHVAGIIGASANGFGMMGVAPGAKLVNLAIMDDDGKIENEYAARVLEYGLNNGIRIFNNSWGSYVYVPSGDLAADRASFEEDDAELLAAAREAARRGAVLVWATGNDGATDAGVQAAMPYLYPELTPNWIAVTSVGRDGTSPAYSNHCGVTMMWCLAAPGGGDDQDNDGIYSTANTGGYVRFSGTSMATPHVTGALAIAQQMYPNATPEQLARLVLLTASDIGAAGIDRQYGWGLLNLDRLTSTNDVRKVSSFSQTAQVQTQAVNQVMGITEQRASALLDPAGPAVAVSTNGAAPSEASRRFWVQSLAGVSLMDGTSTSASSTSRSAGLLVGGEFIATENLRLGAAGGFSTSSMHGGGDRARISGLHALIYGGYTYDRYFLEAASSFSRFENTLDRNNITGSGTSLAVNGQTKTTDLGLSASARIGMTFETEGLLARPYVHGRVRHQWLGSGNETGADVFNVSLRSTTSTGSETGVGLRLSATPIALGSYSVTPMMDIAYARALGPVAAGRNVQMLGRSINSAAPDLGRDIGRLNLGVAATNASQKLTGKLSYGGELRRNAQSHSVNAELSLRF